MAILRWLRRLRGPWVLRASKGLKIAVCTPPRLQAREARSGQLNRADTVEQQPDADAAGARSIMAPHDRAAEFVIAENIGADVQPRGGADIVANKAVAESSPS